MLAIGFFVGVGITFLLMKWQHENEISRRFGRVSTYRHRQTGELYDYVCKAAPPQDPMGQKHVLLHVARFNGDMEARHEIWDGDSFDATFEFQPTNSN